MSTPPEDGPEQPEQPEQPLQPDEDTPLLPSQSREDTDAGWGEYGDRDDDRLLRDRPPHWGNG
jgi:hypothetical protein